MNISKLIVFAFFMTLGATVLAQTAAEWNKKATAYLEQKDYAQAAECWHKAAEMGDVEAMNDYGYCLFSGTGVAQDLPRAIEWLKKAAEKGNIISQFNLGYCYQNGYGVSKNNKDAIKWYTLAAAKRHIPAIKALISIELYPVTDDSTGKRGFRDINRTIIIPCEYDDVSVFSGRLATVKRNGVWGLIDKNNNVVVPFEYERQIIRFNEGEEMISIKNNGEWGVIDKNNNVVIPFKYDYAGSFVDGMVAVSKSGRWGFVDNNNNVVIPFDYDEFGAGMSQWNFNCYTFQDGLLSVKKDGKWGVIDKSNKQILPFIYDYIIHFFDENGHAEVNKNGKVFYIDIHGKEVQIDD